MKEDIMIGTHYSRKMDDVFNSCNTIEQVEVAKRYNELLAKRLIKNFMANLSPHNKERGLTYQAILTKYHIININEKAGMAIRRIQEEEMIPDICRHWSAI